MAVVLLSSRPALLAGLRLPPSGRDHSPTPVRRGAKRGGLQLLSLHPCSVLHHLLSQCPGMGEPSQWSTRVVKAPRGPASAACRPGACAGVRRAAGATPRPAAARAGAAAGPGRRTRPCAGRQPAGARRVCSGILAVRGRLSPGACAGSLLAPGAFAQTCGCRGGQSPVIPRAKRREPAGARRACWVIPAAEQHVLCMGRMLGCIIVWRGRLNFRDHTACWG